MKLSSSNPNGMVRGPLRVRVRVRIRVPTPTPTIGLGFLLRLASFSLSESLLGYHGARRPSAILRSAKQLGAARRR